MLRTHSPMHKQARIIRGLAKRLEDVEQDREVEGRVDFSRSVTEASIATATAEYDTHDLNTLHFGWDTDNPGWDITTLNEETRYITLPGGDLRASAVGRGEAGGHATGNWTVSSDVVGRAVTTSEPRITTHSPYNGPEPNSNGPYGLDTGDVSGSWSPTLVDDFDQGALDTSIWSIGYGWGRTSDPRLEYVRDEDVWVDDQNRLVLQVDKDPDAVNDASDQENNGWYSGAINTQDKHTQQHGFWEASIKLLEPSEGLIPAFWAKPNNEDWPPEIDFVEQFDSQTQTAHTVHYEDCDGNKDEYDERVHSDTPTHENYYVFGCEWRSDVVIWYINGTEIGRTSAGSGDTCRFLDYGQPFYTMLSCHIWETDWLGNPQNNSDYPYEWYVDWVRVWESN